MTSFAIEIWDNECNLCTFYSVRWLDQRECETDRFIQKYADDDELAESVDELISFIVESIGNRYGAIDELFNRFENEVIGLPPKGKIRLSGNVVHHFPQFPLRIYTLRLTEQLVILFNGGIKDDATNQASSLSLEWRNACSFARRIIEAWNSEMIIADPTGRKILTFNESEEIIL